MSLRERRDILALAGDAQHGMLVTLVHADGPSYRRPGAHLLALPDGRSAGSISGGCLEADLLRKGAWHLRHGATVLRYDTALDDDADMPFGLGCGGAIDLLLEDLHTREAQAVVEAIAASLPDPKSAGRSAARTIVTQLPSHPLGFARIVLDGTGDVVFATESLETDRIVDLRAAARNPSADRTALYIETLAAAQRLVLCGAGEDARPVVRFAAELGWSVVVIDGRPQFARGERFPQADVVVCADTLAALHVNADDAVVVMTHSFQQDEHFLTEMLQLPASQRPRYIGLLGARARSALLLRHAAAAADLSFEHAVQAVHAPVGFNLGGDGPDSIALAIVAEIQHHLHAPAAPEADLQQSMSAATATEALARLDERSGNPAASYACSLDSFRTDASPAAVTPDEAVLRAGSAV